MQRLLLRRRTAKQLVLLQFLLTIHWLFLRICKILAFNLLNRVLARINLRRFVRSKLIGVLIRS